MPFDIDTASNQSNVTIGAGDTVECTSYCAVKTSIPMSGKIYFEVKCDQGPFTGSLGFCRSTVDTAAMNPSAGNTMHNSAATAHKVASGYFWTLFHMWDGSHVGSYGTTPAAATIYMFAIDTALGKFSIGVNGSWGYGADPSIPVWSNDSTGMHDIETGDYNVFFNTDGQNITVGADFAFAAGDLTYSLPTGFSVVDDFVSTVEHTGTGTMPSAAAAVSGTAERELVGVGTVLAPNSTVNGTGERTVNGTGSIASDDSAVTATVKRTLKPVVANIASDDSVVSGVAERIVVGQGSIVADNANFAGVEFPKHSGSGAIASDDSAVSAVAEREIIGVASIVAAPSAVSAVAERVIVGGGTIVATQPLVLGFDVPPVDTPTARRGPITLTGSRRAAVSTGDLT